MRHFSRRSDDADVIRARLRALLDDGRRGGWLPEELEDEPAEDERADRDQEPPCPAPEPPAGVGRHRRPGPAVRWDPGRRGARSLWTAGLLTALVVVVWTWLERPTVEPAPPPAGATQTSAHVPDPVVGEAAETASTVVVAVVGLVARPGLVTVPSGSRVADAIEAAGGFLPGTDPAAVNLAAVVADGQQIAVGVAGAADGGVAPGPGSPAPGGLVNLNTASVTELDALPGIGPVLAQRIVDHRSQQGRFRSVAELDDVPGIGPAIAAELAELVTV